MAYLRQFGIGTPTIGTPLANTLDTITQVNTGKPAVGPTGRTPVHIGYDPLQSTWDALTEWPVTSDIVDVTVDIVTAADKVVDEIVVIAEDVYDFAKDVASEILAAVLAIEGLIEDGFSFLGWLFDHPYALVGSVLTIGGVVIVGGLVVFAALR